LRFAASGAIVWDEKKREANIDGHGLDFALAEKHFDWNGAHVLRSYAGKRGDVRHRSIGLLDGERLITVIISPLGSEAISIISMRAASAKERKIYAEEKGL
jgi:uncharacterized DUF497 family protein